jgi:preprotein translocase subunit SecG
MGVKQSTDVMEKGTWVTMAIIAALSILSVSMFETPKEVKQPQQSSAPAQQQQPTGK